MDLFDLFTLSERGMELVNPTSPEKVVEAGRRLGLEQSSRVIDFGCGYAEPLVLWAEQFGIHGVGIDIRESACDRARAKVTARGLQDRLQIACAPAAGYRFEEGSFDAASCLGASFAFGGYEGALQALKRAVNPGGRVAIGEPYWLHDAVSAELVKRWGFHSEPELVDLARASGLQLEAIIRSGPEDWDRYQSDNWRGQLAWLQENPDHPDYGQVRSWYLDNQDEYLTAMQRYVGWAIYVFVSFDIGA